MPVDEIVAVFEIFLGDWLRTDLRIKQPFDVEV